MLYPYFHDIFIPTTIETTRKILEDLQVKKQLLQKGVAPTVLTSSMNQASPAQATEGYTQSVSGTTPATTQRTTFNLNSSTTLGFFIQQDSHYGNTFIPVLPRFESSPAPNHTASK